MLKKFSNCLNINSSNISVVSNTYNSVFNKKISPHKIPLIFKNNSFKLITISSYYNHKNLEIINDLINVIPEKYDIKFYLTIKQSIF